MKVIAKYKSLSLPVKAAFWFIIMSLIQKAFSFITVPIFTRIMSVEQYGLYSTYLSWSSILMVFFTLNLETGAYSNVLGKEKDDNKKNKMTISYITLSFCITSIACVFILIFKESLSKFWGMPFLLILLMLVEVYATPAIRFWNLKQKFDYKYKLMVVYTLSTTFINVFAGIILVSNVGEIYQAEARLSVIAVVKLISAIVMYLYFVKKSGIFFSYQDWIETLKFQLPLIPYNLALIILFSSDRIMIQKIVSLSAAAIYSVAYSAGQLMTILNTCIIDAIRPWIYEKLNNKNYRDMDKIISVVIFILMICCFAFSIFAPEIIKIMASKDYYSAIYVIPPVAMSSLFTFIYQLFVIVETYFGESKKIMKWSIFSAIFNILLNFILIPKFGFVAAGYTTLMSYGLLCILYYKELIKIEKQNNIETHLFNYNLIVVISIIGILSCLLISFLYSYIIVRYVILFILLLMFIFFRKKIIVIYKSIKK